MPSTMMKYLKIVVVPLILSFSTGLSGGDALGGLWAALMLLLTLSGGLLFVRREEDIRVS